MSGAVCCSLLQAATVCVVAHESAWMFHSSALQWVLQCVAVCCGISLINTRVVINTPLSFAVTRFVVCCRVLQCMAVCCNVLQDVAVCCFRCHSLGSVLQCVAVCCSVLRCVAVCCSVVQWNTVCCSVLQWVSLPMNLTSLSITYSVAVYCNVLQGVAVAVCCGV